MVKLEGQNYIIFVRGQNYYNDKHKGPKMRLSFFFKTK